MKEAFAEVCCVIVGEDLTELEATLDKVVDEIVADLEGAIAGD